METQVAIRCSWWLVGAVEYRDGRLVWPEIPSGSGVYRFVLSLRDRTRTYVGETNDYRRRFVHYAKPGATQRTNLRMNARLISLLSDHAGTATVEVATDVRLSVARADLPLAAVPGVFSRRLLENAILVAAVADGMEIINGAGYPPGELWEDE